MGAVQIPEYPLPAPFCLTCSVQVRPRPLVSVMAMVVTPAPPLDCTMATSSDPFGGANAAVVTVVARASTPAGDEASSASVPEALISHRQIEMPLAAEV